MERISFKLVVLIKKNTALFGCLNKRWNRRLKFFSKRVVFFLLFLSMSVSALPKLNCQTTKPEKIDRTPAPYEENEFPLWVHELRRFEILTFGSLPLVTMLSFWTYDISRSIKHQGDERYYPWPIKKAEIAIPLTSTEQKKVFFTSVGISAGIALTDIIVRAIIRSVREKKMVKENIIQDSYIQLLPIE